MNPNNDKISVFITGATGFVGTALIKRLLQENVRLYAAVLDKEYVGHLPSEVEQVVVKPLSESNDYSSVLQKVNVVIHLAARVHIMRESAVDPLYEFRKVNLHGTRCLAQQAAKYGVKRFVFMSTIGVNGNSSRNKQFIETDSPNPCNPYSVSKLEAEICLRQLSEETGMEVVVVRAPLVYGPRNPGNFLSLLQVISKGIPLPLAAVQNKKSFLFVYNLADALTCCVTHPKAAGQTFLVSDGENVSTPELIRQVACALGCPVKLIPIYPSLIRFAGKLIGKASVVNQLVESLAVDSTNISRLLGWTPPFTMQEGLKETALWFKAQ